MLHVSRILENAADVAPDAIAATLDDGALTFADIERGGNATAHALLRAGVARGDRLLYWGDTSLDAIAVFADSILYVNTEECTSCTACYQPDVCPVGAIYAEEHKQPDFAAWFRKEYP